MAEFGMESQKPKTPAKLSKNYDLNAYYGELEIAQSPALIQ